MNVEDLERYGSGRSTAVSSGPGGSRAGRVSQAAPAGAEREEQRLLDALLAAPRGRRLAMVRKEERFHRPALLALANQRAERAFFLPGTDAAGGEVAEVAAALVAPLAASLPKQLRRSPALAHWLLGKHRLQQGDGEGAAAAFLEMEPLLPANEPAEERALALCGRAQVQQDAGRPIEAKRLFQRAAAAWKQMGERGAPLAGCLAELGFLLVDLDEAALAFRHLERAFQHFDAAGSPVLGGRMAYACAELEATLLAAHLERPPAPPAGAWLEQARRLGRLPAAPGEEVNRVWNEGRVAAVSGLFQEADRLLDSARRALLARGSLSEAVRCTFDHLIVRHTVAAPDDATGDLLSSLESAFGKPARRWAKTLEVLVKAAEDDIGQLHATRGDFFVYLQKVRPESLRPDLLAANRAFTDRLMRRRGRM